VSSVSWMLLFPFSSSFLNSTFTFNLDSLHPASLRVIRRIGELVKKKQSAIDSSFYFSSSLLLPLLPCLFLLPQLTLLRILLLGAYRITTLLPPFLS
jgi:hypothetical protein